MPELNFRYSNAKLLSSRDDIFVEVGERRSREGGIELTLHMGAKKVKFFAAYHYNSFEDTVVWSGLQVLTPNTFTIEELPAAIAVMRQALSIFDGLQNLRKRQIRVEF